VDTVANLHAGTEGADLDDDTVFINGDHPGRGATDRKTLVREVQGELVELLLHRLASVSHCNYP
jgi:tRNA pseudouridine-54 N-methylase